MKLTKKQKDELFEVLSAISAARSYLEHPQPNDIPHAYLHCDAAITKLRAFLA